jgi:hypothetical protein
MFLPQGKAQNVQPAKLSEGAQSQGSGECGTHHPGHPGHQAARRQRLLHYFDKKTRFMRRAASHAMHVARSSGACLANPKASFSALACRVRRMRYAEIASSRWTYAMKLTAANVIAMYLGFVLTGSGFWAGVSVCVMGPRESLHGGSTFRVGLMRAGGTVIGSMWGYVVALVVGGHSHQGILQHALFAVSSSYSPYLASLTCATNMRLVCKTLFRAWV